MRLLIGLTILVAVSAATPATAQNAAAAPVDRATALTAARRLINESRPRDAIRQLEGISDPAAPDVVELLGVAYYHADDHQRAIALLSPVVNRLPRGSVEQREAVQVLGLSLFLAGRFADALPYLEQTRVWATDNVELAYVLGQAYVQTRQPARAREALAGVFLQPPDSAAAHLLTAQMMIRLEQEQDAEAELKRALEKAPALPRANYLLGQIALFRGRFDDAIAYSNREIEINPTDAMAFYQLGDVYVRQSNWDRALVALQRSLWINPFYSGPYILLGKVYLQKSQPLTAEGMLRRGIDYDPNNRAAHYLLAQVLQQTGRLGEAKQEFAIAERLQGAVR